MSDDFDKEAEREKLREQFEADRQRREATQQMSELLLKGATMTNMHCDSCGDPVFRHDGQEFCANCQTVAMEGDEASAAVDDGPAAEGDAALSAPGETDEADEVDDADETPDRADEVPVEPQSRTDAGASSAPASTTPDRTPERAPERTSERRSPDAGRASSTDAGGQPSPGRGQEESPTAARRDPSSQRTAAAGDEAVDAPAALQRSLEKFSRLAAETDDPREAKHHLEAAREAAEALAALRK